MLGWLPLQNKTKERQEPEPEPHRWYFHQGPSPDETAARTSGVEAKHACGSTQTEVVIL